MNYFEFFLKNLGRHSPNLRRVPSWQVRRHSPNDVAFVPARKAIGEYSANVRRLPSWQVRRPVRSASAFVPTRKALAKYSASAFLDFCKKKIQTSSFLIINKFIFEI